jgi:dTDP-4-amino-4,6-dideoxygalactose transaminase
MTTQIPFNKPYLQGRELAHIAQAAVTAKLSGDGPFTRRCSEYFERRYGVHKALLTTSCTDALELAALLLDLEPGDEVIVPSYTFVSTANAFALRGARIVFADSGPTSPNVDAEALEALITPRTRALAVVHYAGIACDMDAILALAARHGLAVVEDAAQAVDSFHRGRTLGTLGTFGAFSFHETKNIIAGEGGLLAVNDARHALRAEILREKGTNRSAFFRGEIDKYGWVDVGSSFLPSELVAAYLWGQLEHLDAIQALRRAIWERYDAHFRGHLPEHVQLPDVPAWATNNGHMYYLVCRDLAERTALIAALRAQGIHAVFHYLSLHASPYFAERHDGRRLPHSDRYADCLVRLPLFVELTDGEVDRIAEATAAFLRGAR